MQCYTELTPPTVVTHAVSLPLLSSKAINLVVAKTSVLQIFNLTQISTEVGAAANDGEDNSPMDNAAETLDGFNADMDLHRLEHTARLVLISEHSLAGTVTSIRRVKTMNTKSGGEALLIAFADAKLSLVEWDPEKCTLSTISIHYYEGESLQGCPWTPELSLCHNFLTVDPTSRCAALKFGHRHLAILPFRQIAGDLGEVDFDEGFDDPAERPLERKATNGDIPTPGQTPYHSSFVLSLTTLDPTLTHPVHLAFLHEYREPTFGVLYSSRALGSAMLQERKDILSYTVFTLDIEQRASTTILSIAELPNDLYEVLPLPLPVGGALLVGSNELVHVDEAGKTNGLAVNEFCKQISAFPMVDQAELGLRLEGCKIEQLGDGGDMLIILTSGQLAIITFTMEGRSVSGLRVHKVTADHGGFLPAGASCACSLGKGKIFLGSEDSDAVVLGWSRKAPQLVRKRSHVDILDDEVEISFDDVDFEEDDDDLYGGDESLTKQQSRANISGPANPADFFFRVHDKLPNYAPVGDITIGVAQASSPTSKEDTGSDPIAERELVYPAGRKSAGGLAVLRREIDPAVLSRKSLPRTKAIWGVRPIVGLAAGAEFDEFLVASLSTENGSAESALYKVTDTGLEPTQKDDFDPEAGATIEVGTVAGSSRIVQVLSDEAKCYDAEFNMEQIIPASDETTEVELKNIGACFCDPYVLLLRDDSSIAVHQADKNGELEPLDRGDGILASRWLSACLYKSAETNNKTLLFGLTGEGQLRVFELPNLEAHVYAADGLAFLPPTLGDVVPRRQTGRESLTEILVADIGDETSKSMYLIIRTENNDLVLYEPFHYPERSHSKSFTTDLQWKKIPQPRMAKTTNEPDLEEDDVPRESTLQHLENVGGYSTVFQAGKSPCFILKEAATPPRLVNLRGGTVQSLTGFHTAVCDRGFAYLDAEEMVRTCQLPPQCRYGDTGWVSRKVNLQEEVQATCYFARKGLYAVATSEQFFFKLEDDNYHHEWAYEETSFLPTIDQATIKLLHPKDWSTIDTFALEPAEVVLTMKTLNLVTSENNSAKKALLCVGTAITHGEDLPTKGNVYIFDIIDVVPHPDRPETGSKLKLICKEEVKGAVNGLSDIGTEGFLLMNQGQKVLVRGLKEDQTLLPVAFMDVQVYVSALKALPGTGMCLVGDAVKGIWFAGYTEEPYKMFLFGKGRSRMEVITAEFLPHNKNLFILVADADCNLHVYQFDPEHPQSLSGQRLLHKSTFHLGHFPISMTLLPPLTTAPTPNPDTEAMETDPPSEEPQPPNHVLLTTQSGALGLLTPINETVYRRLGALQAFLTNSLDHACGLNPRGYRSVETERYGSRGIVDGTVLRRWSELSSGRRMEAIAKVGVEEAELRADLAMVGEAGLGYF
ncbi:hypothetical protein FKW77_009040 [Venturia effusa]|uniref:mRNA cleavage and polyadenylation factor subunit n=1 Tax=Venturia effusa TaxID=50376 RepID=A0A517KX62_9PEZI|nr:hypothetical protein FKW77_009040 [Venturia effusa]